MAIGSGFCCAICGEVEAGCGGHCGRKILCINSPHNFGCLLLLVAVLVADLFIYIDIEIQLLYSYQIEPID